MSLIKSTTLFLSGLFLVGCQSTPKTQFTDVSVPELNQVVSRTLGERLLLQGKGYFADSITVEALDAHTADIPRTTTFYRIQTTDNFSSNQPDTVILNNSFGSPISRTNRITYTTGQDKFCVSFMLCFNSNEASFKYDPEKKLRVLPNSFQQVIEYNGKSGDTLKFTYREFSDDMARSAFTTDFTMDLNEGNQVSYKGAVIEILEATNSKIKYKVLKNFNN